MTVAKTGRPPGESVRTARIKPAPDELTDAEAARIVAYYEANPDAGYKQALQAIGYHAPSDQAKTLILAHVERDDLLAATGLSAESAFHRIAKIAGDLEHKDAFRANTFILNAVHGIREGEQLDVNVNGQVEIDDRSAPLDAVQRVLQAVNALDVSGTARRALPAAGEVLAEPAAG